jgi:hypothetical protein
MFLFCSYLEAKQASTKGALKRRWPMRLKVVNEGTRLFVSAAALVAHVPLLTPPPKRVPAMQKQIPFDVRNMAFTVTKVKLAILQKI